MRRPLTVTKRSVGCWVWSSSGASKVRKTVTIIKPPKHAFPSHEEGNFHRPCRTASKTKCDQSIIGARPGRDHDELFARPRPERHWNCRVLVRNFPAPKLPAVSLIESVEIS